MKTVKLEQRATNWDLLRSLAMFLVLVVHSASYIGPIHGIDFGSGILCFALICDPVFFVLSGYFAFRPLNRPLKEYYYNKFLTILLPLMLYSVLLFAYSCISGSATFSLNSYFSYFNNLLTNGWWFIPSLVPCLIVAPFLYKGLEAISNKQILFLSKLLFVLYFVGLICITCQSVFEKIEIDTVDNFFKLSISFIPPSVLSHSVEYFQFFILGGIFRRVLPLLTRKSQNILIIIGLMCWLLDISTTYIGIPRHDGNCWIFASFAIMILFSRLDIKNKIAKIAITWTAKRSYSIYLLQYTAISVIFGAIYTNALFGDVSHMFVIYRIGIWLIAVFVSYLLSLAVASIIDPLILNKIQSLFRKIKLKRLPDNAS